VDRELETCIPHWGLHPDIESALRYIFIGAGKALRPGLLFHSFSALGGQNLQSSGVLKWGLAVELIHTYSLIHDDLPCMDNDDFRRGKATLHKLHGEAKALLGGDALLTLAFEVLASWPHAKLGRATSMLARAAGGAGMVAGQWLDMEQDADFLKIHNLKTGALMGAAMGLGALAANSDEAMCLEFESLGRELGVVFQLEDDILDATASSEALGKSAGKDAAQGKSSLVKAHGLDGAIAFRDDAVRSLRARLERYPSLGDPERLMGLFAQRKK
jgi:geranylgeranyl pyrophosphate synthase